MFSLWTDLHMSRILERFPFGEIQKVVGGNIELCQKFDILSMFTSESPRWKIANKLLTTSAEVYANENGMYEKSPNMATKPMIFGQIAIVASKAHFKEINIDPSCLTLRENVLDNVDEVEEEEIEELAMEADWDFENGRFYEKKC